MSPRSYLQAYRNRNRVAKEQATVQAANAAAAADAKKEQEAKTQETNKNVEEKNSK